MYAPLFLHILKILYMILTFHFSIVNKNSHLYPISPF